MFSPTFASQWSPRTVSPSLVASREGKLPITTSDHDLPLNSKPTSLFACSVLPLRCLLEHHTHAVPTDVRRKGWVPCNWSYKHGYWGSNQHPLRAARALSCLSSPIDWLRSLSLATPELLTFLSCAYIPPFQETIPFCQFQLRALSSPVTPCIPHHPNPDSCGAHNSKHTQLFLTTISAATEF